MTIVRPLNDEDLPQLTALLWQHKETSLFILGNLELSGLAAGDEPYQGDYIGGFVDGELRGVIVRYWNGNCMPQGDAATVMDIWQQSPVFRTGTNGFVGQYERCLQLRDAYLQEHQLTESALALNSREVLYELPLSQLTLPDVATQAASRLSLATEDDMTFLLPWMIDYNVETLNATRGQALAEHCHDSLRNRIQLRNCFVFWQGGTPVATTGFNARVQTMIQVGGVFTPEAFRGRGYAQAAVGLSLQQVMQEGVEHCVLFTDEHNQAARGAYERLGFQFTGYFGLYLVTA
ncbi:GNAT family N-acetyltransferase [Reinekea blandensis]|uniref:N-acetyltransferase domain-containing protein n=1 Tax=Reinekea blandensis MED297 TaxID=314283 RepID=A4B900_9GAMM|nr:GNAT family N-acetyltransferase [Reinekea blandensis]EAR11101.1 hypothetical protein MED297_19477 [Reinekea sp. MED297] [Reinekea blandensis MED297]